MLSPILAMAYLEIVIQDLPWTTAVARLGALAVSAALLAGYGLVVNDWSDIEPDRVTGKPNTMASVPMPARMSVAIALVAVGAVPWILVGVNGAGIVTLAVIYLLPLLYSARPVRLKERGGVGLVADAANALVAPAVFVVVLFSRSGRASTVLAAVTGSAIVAWAIGYGLRGIVLHQLTDAPLDRASGVRTFVTRVGPDAAQRLARAVFPLEVVGLTVMLGVALVRAPLAGAAFLVYAALFQGARKVGAVSSPITAGRASNGYVMLAEFYDVWPSTFLVVGLVAVHPAYWWVALVHLVVFHGGIAKQGRDVVFMIVKIAEWVVKGADGTTVTVTTPAGSAEMTQFDDDGDGTTRTPPGPGWVRRWLARSALVAPLVRSRRRRTYVDDVLASQLKSLEDQIREVSSQLHSLRQVVLDMLPEVVDPPARSRSDLHQLWATTRVPSRLRCEIDKNDPMFLYLLGSGISDPHAAYLRSGLSHVAVLDSVIRARFGSWDRLGALLDFASGYGRDTRFMVELLEPDRIWVSDTKARAVQFQQEHFGVHGVVSVPRPEAVAFDRRFDCVIAISLFTHLPRDTFERWLGQLWNLVEPTGILMFTVHDAGRAGQPRRNRAPAIIAGDGDTGDEDFLFVPHDESPWVTADPGLGEPAFGATFVSEAFVRTLLERMGIDGSRRFPRAIDDYQDLWVVPKGGPALPSDLSVPPNPEEADPLPWRTPTEVG